MPGERNVGRVLGRRASIGVLVVVLAAAAAAAVAVFYPTGSKSAKAHLVRCAHASRSGLAARRLRRQRCVARQRLAELRLPEGAVQVRSASQLGRFGWQLKAIGGKACSPVVRSAAFWHVPDITASDLIKWIQAHSPTGAHQTGSGEGRPAGGLREWSGQLSFAVEQPQLALREELMLSTIEAGEGAALRAETLVVPASGACHEYDY